MAFNRNRPFNNNRGGFGGDRGGFEKRTMHQTVCDKCRKECEVPFRPTSGKPVYCNNCFDRPTSGRSEERNFQRPNFEERRTPNYEQQFAELNSKLDKILGILTPIAEEVEAEVEQEAEAGDEEVAEEATEEATEVKIEAPKKSSKKK